MGGVGDTHGSFTGQLIYTDILHACLLFECPRPPKKKNDDCEVENRVAFSKYLWV